MSGGSLLLAGGTPGRRAVLPNSRILIHQPSGGFQGQSSDVAIHAREAIALRDRLEEIYAADTGQPLAQVHEDMERDRFFTAAEAVAYGLADRILTVREEGPDGGRERRRTGFGEADAAGPEGVGRYRFGMPFVQLPARPVERGSPTTRRGGRRARPCSTCTAAGARRSIRATRRRPRCATARG